MKKTICIALLISMFTSAFGQQSPTRTDYLGKSKRQKSGALVLLCGGSALIIGGFLIGDNKSSSFDDAGTGVVMGGIGFLSCVGSIPLFIASGKNKRRAKKATTFFKMEAAPVIRQHSFVRRSFPAFSVRLSL